jgi:alkyl hydroperoxide reductase subunit AhpC
MSEWSPTLNIELGETYEKYKNRGLVIYQVSLDSDLHFWRNAAVNIPWVCVRDPQSVYSEAAAMYNVRQLPTLFILDRQGNLVQRVENLEQLEGILNRLLR